MASSAKARKAIVTVLVIAGLMTGGCEAVMITAAQFGWEDRSTDDQVTDTKIASGILKRLGEEEKKLLLDLNVDVWEQRVLFTGSLDDRDLLSKAGKLARADKRIKAFYNEVQLVSTAAKEERRQQTPSGDKGNDSGVGQTIDDLWIETKIKFQLLAADGVISVNYRWQSVFNTIYIIGRAGSEHEKRKVLSIVRETDGVNSVKEFIQVKPRIYG